MLLLILVVIEGVAIAAKFEAEKAQTDRLKMVANRIFKKCSSEASPLICYNTEIPKLLGEISLADAFSVTRLVQGKDSALTNCHIVAHKLISKSLESNIGNWKKTITGCQANICENGCLHGVIEARFESERLTKSQLNSLIRELDGICEPRPDWSPTQSQKYSCYHGLGHLFMYATAANIETAPALCSAVTQKFGKAPLMNCLAGVFMQIYRFVDEEDKALVKNIAPKNKEEVTKLCSQFADSNYRDACYVESWPIFAFAYLADVEKPQKTTEFCSPIKSEYSLQYCYQSVINEITGFLINKEGGFRRINDYCNGLLEAWQSSCYEFAATHLVHIEPKYVNKSIAICNNAPSRYKSDCFEAMINMKSFSFKKGSQESEDFCKSFPSPWDKNCLTLQT